MWKFLVSALLVLLCLVTIFPSQSNTLQAQDRPARMDPSVKLLSIRQTGSAIEDGIGFGGIHIATPERELLAKWGDTSVNKMSAHSIFNYLLDSGEAVLVQVKDAQVRAILFWPGSSLSLPSQVKTRKGISIGTSFETVIKAYGNPESRKDSGALYISQGIGFHPEGGLVAAIIIFQPGTPPE